MKVVSVILAGVVTMGSGTASQAQSGGRSRAVGLGQPNAARFPRVTVYAYPTDAAGALVRDLSADAFEVVENGSPAEVLSVESRGGTLDVCIALDRSPSMEDEGKIESARSAAHEFLRNLEPQDRAALVTFADSSTLDQNLTRDRFAMESAISRTVTSGDRTTFLDGIYWSITQVGLQAPGAGSVIGSGPASPDARRVVVALTDGRDRGSRVLPGELVEVARQNGVSLYMIALGEDAETGQMEYLAAETGGRFLRAPRPENLKQLYVSIAQQLRQEYRVTFRSPSPAADGSRRSVVLTANGARTETWYLAPTQGNLLGGIVPSGGNGSAVNAATGRRNTPPFLWIGALLVFLGLAGGLTAFLIRMGRRPATLNIEDSNPRLDLLPLWVREGETRIGRAPECELILDSREVSRVHARIESWEGVFRLVDEGSSNGTYVNGRRVRRKEIRVGDVVRFGDREFRFAGDAPH